MGMCSSKCSQCDKDVKSEEGVKFCSEGCAEAYKKLV